MIIESEIRKAVKEVFEKINSIPQENILSAKESIKKTKRPILSVSSDTTFSGWKILVRLELIEERSLYCSFLLSKEVKTTKEVKTIYIDLAVGDDIVCLSHKETRTAIYLEIAETLDNVFEEMFLFSSHQKHLAESM